MTREVLMRKEQTNTRPRIRIYADTCTRTRSKQSTATSSAKVLKSPRAPIIPRSNAAAKLRASQHRN
jgi:hypothetical protein